jgi:hypothetical protein
MTSDKYFKMYEEAEELPDRARYMADGVHDVVIHKVETVDTEGGERCFVEYAIKHTAGTRNKIYNNKTGEEEPQEPHFIGEIVKQSFPRSGAPKWQIEKTFRIFKRIVALCSASIKSKEDLDAAMGVAGASSPLVGGNLRITGSYQRSESGKWFNKFDYALPKHSTPSSATEATEGSSEDLDSGDIPF